MFQTVWVLTNIASGAYTYIHNKLVQNNNNNNIYIILGSTTAVQALLEHEIVRPVFKILQYEGKYETLNTSRQQLVDQCVWLLANIAGDSITARDLMLEMSLDTHLTRLVESLEGSANASESDIAKKLAFCFVNCVRLKPKPSMEVRERVVQGVLSLIDISGAAPSDTNEMLTNCLWCINHASSDGLESILYFFTEIAIPPRSVTP